MSKSRGIQKQCKKLFILVWTEAYDLVHHSEDSKFRSIMLIWMWQPSYYKDPLEIFNVNCKNVVNNILLKTDDCRF
jgi:hypothetical protein